MMPKGDTITEIMRINRSARPEFLSEFSPDDLLRYLERLSTLRPSERAKVVSPLVSPGATALRSAVRAVQKDAPFRFTSDATRV